MSNVGRGIAGERRAWHSLEDAGYLVASRRHIGGAGDILAVIPRPKLKPTVAALLVEVKTNGSSPFATFYPPDRAELIATAIEYQCTPLLCWTPSASTIFYIPEDEWPG